MGQVGPKMRTVEGGHLTFWCPGCDGAHAVTVGAGAGPRWGYNGNADRPTFTPSILVRSTEFTDKGRAQYEAWRALGYPPTGEAFDSKPTVCHSYVTDGRIQFLADCTHGLAGKTVDLPDLPDWLRD